MNFKIFSLLCIFAVLSSSLAAFNEVSVKRKEIIEKMKSLNHGAFNNIRKSKNSNATYPILEGYSVRLHIAEHYASTDIFMTNTLYVEDIYATYADFNMVQRMNITISRSNDVHATNFTYLSIDYDRSGFINTNLMNEMLEACKCKDIPPNFVSFTYLFTCPNTYEFYTPILQNYTALLNTKVSFATIIKHDYAAYVIDYATNEIDDLKPQFEVLTIDLIEQMIPTFPDNPNSISNSNNHYHFNHHHHHHHHHEYLRKDKSLKLLYRYFKGLKERTSNLLKRNSNEKALYPIPSNLGAELHNIIDDGDTYTLESFYESNNTFVGVGNITLKGVDKLIFRYEYDMIRKDNNNNTLMSVKWLRNARSGMYATNYIVNYLTTAGCKNVPIDFINMEYLEGCEGASGILNMMEFSIGILATDYLEALKVEESKNAYYVDDLGNICEDYKVFDLKPFDQVDKDIPDVKISSKNN